MVFTQKIIFGTKKIITFIHFFPLWCVILAQGNKHVKVNKGCNLLKYYSLIVADGKTFILVFCVL